MAKTADYCFGEFDFARGWFMIAGAGEVQNKPVPLRFFGEDMVLYRGESGKAYLVDAYCPHMGTHLVRRSNSHVMIDVDQIQGESIRCPLHGWRFGAGGECDHIPYSTFVPEAARLRVYPVVERAGVIWMWHDPEGLDPDYPLPDFGGHYDQPGWVNWKIDHLGDIDIHGCEIVDNMADLGHMAPIHGAQRCIYFDNVFDGHVVHQHFSVVNRGFDGVAPFRSDLDTWYTGPGLLQSDMQGDIPVFMVVAHTPIDDGKTRVWHAVMVRMGDGSLALTDEERAMAFQIQEGYRFGLIQDVEIWANKRVCINPLALPADGPYGKLRIWYKQFYNPRERAEEFHKRVNGTFVALDERAREGAVQAA